jgi:hypothetical protein
MKDKLFYKKQLQESSEVRFDINETHRPHMKHLARIFKCVTEQPQKTFKFIKDLMYYRGGYPKATTPAKTSVLITKFINMITYFSILEIEEDVYAQLKAAGITVTVDPSKLKDSQLNLTGKVESRFNKSWKAAFGGKDVPKTVHEVLEVIFDEGCGTQKTICSLADEIKVTAAEKINDKCEISKPVFVKAVNIKYKTMKQKPIDKDIKKLKTRIEHTQDGIIAEF